MAIRASRTKKQERHGKRYLPEYQIWLQMKGRCENPKNHRYKWYGGSGIKVCARWRRSFNAFYADMGPRPEGMTLERKDSTKNYTPANCRWDTWDAQRRNKRNNKFYEFDGKRLVLPDWAKLLGIKKTVLRARLENYGWPVDKAFTTPSGTASKTYTPITHGGRTQSIAAWARELGVNRKWLASQLSAGRKICELVPCVT